MDLLQAKSEAAHAVKDLVRGLDPKTDRTDAAALLEAVRSGELPRVPVKSVAQQALVAVHRVRAQWMTTRTARINVLRGLLREQGLLLPASARGAWRRCRRLLEDPDIAVRATRAIAEHS
jgi:transposase